MLAGVLFISYSLQGLALGVDKYTQSTAVQTIFEQNFVYESKDLWSITVM